MERVLFEPAFRGHGPWVQTRSYATGVQTSTDKSTDTMSLLVITQYLSVTDLSTG